ncbi:MAG TPA: hypothetical protein VNT29_10710, partial [Candidatus Limnocylindrales bacterium]|nr:hypothetical protein [Candidatus Limnocylindrales bacterium]
GELHVGHDLLRTGCTIRYDDKYQVDGGLLTPDWTAVFDGKTFVCDAFTAGLLDERKAFEDHVTALSARLSKIEAPYFVKVEVAAEAGFTEAERKRITQEFSNAVRRGMAMGTVWRDDGCTIEILGPTADHIEVMTLDPMHLVRTPVSISDTILEKSKKYAALGLPILVAAIPHPRAETNLVMFEDIIRGELIYKSIQMPDGRIIEGIARRTGGVLERRPELSAAMWRNPYTTHPEKAFAMFENDRVVHPLPRSFVERLRSLYPG